MSPPDALRDALAHVIANERREWRRERELIESEARRVVAELRAQIVELHQTLKESVDARLAVLKDGAPGERGEAGERGRDGAPGGEGPAGRDGADGAPGRDGLDGKDGPTGSNGADGRQGERGEQGAPGQDGKDGAAATDEQIDAAVARYLAANPPAPGRDGADGKDGRDGADGAAGQDGAPGADGASGRDGADGKDGPAGRDGSDGKDGAPGERGIEGPPGKLPLVKEWTDGVHYQADVVTRHGAVYQAIRDTGREPPHEDWRLIASAGRDGADGRSFTIRGTWADGIEYRHLDVVALGGASFAAKRDEPGACPGEGWQLIASQGKRGNPGEPGPARRGDPGPAGPPVASIDIDGEGLLTVTNADGSVATCDLYPLLSKVAR